MRRDKDATSNGRVFSSGAAFDAIQGKHFRGKTHSGPGWVCGAHAQRWRKGSQGAGGGPAGPFVGPQPLPLGVRNTVASGQMFSAGVEPGAKRVRTGGAPPSTSATGVLCAGGERLSKPWQAASNCCPLSPCLAGLGFLKRHEISTMK